MENNLWIENNQWCTYWCCIECNENIKCCTSEKKYIKRNLKNKKICKSCSLKKQTGEGNPFFNKKHSVETIKSISNSKIGITTSNHMSRPEYKELFSSMAKERWANGSMENIRTKLSLLMKQRISNGEIKGYNRSKAEDEIIEKLNKLKIDVIPNFIIDGKIFDIYIPKFNLIIEYNGDYWHCNPIKYSGEYYNKKKNKLAKDIWKYDNDKLYLVKNKNYLYEVIWETDYKKDKDLINKIIEKYEH